MNHKLLTLVTDVERIKYFLINSTHSAGFTLHAHSCAAQVKLWSRIQLKYSNWMLLRHSSRVHFAPNMFKNSTNKDIAVTALYSGQVSFWRTPTLWWWQYDC